MGRRLFLWGWPLRFLLDFYQAANGSRIAFTAADRFELGFVKLNQVATIQLRFDLLDVQGIDDKLAMYSDE